MRPSEACRLGLRLSIGAKGEGGGELVGLGLSVDAEGVDGLTRALGCCCWVGLEG